jgi:hypothetical protein
VTGVIQVRERLKESVESSQARPLSAATLDSSTAEELERAHRRIKHLEVLCVSCVSCVCVCENWFLNRLWSKYALSSPL